MKCDALRVDDDICSESKNVSSYFSFPGDSLLCFFMLVVILRFC